MVTIGQLANALNLTLCSGEKGIDLEVTGGYSCDLLSDVMGHAMEGMVWITLQTHKNVMAIASLKELSGVILVKGFQPEKDMADQSDLEGIPVYSTEMSAFEASGKVYQLLKEQGDLSS